MSVASITMDDIKSARQGNAAVQRLICDIVLKDDTGQNKVRSWLFHKGVPAKHHGDLESRIHEVFTQILMKDYCHDKIDFEKFCWQKFGYLLFDFYRQKAAAFNRSVSYVSPLSSDDVEENGNNDFLNFRDAQSDVDFEMSIVQIDLEKIIAGMDVLYKFICRLMFFNQWDKKSICTYLKINGFEFEGAKREFSQRMEKYMRQNS